MRVLYVAMTRAKDMLIMTYAKKNLEKDLRDIALRMDITPNRLMTGSVDCPGKWVLQTALKKTEAGQLHALTGVGVHGSVGNSPWRIEIAKCFSVFIFAYTTMPSSQGTCS